MRLDVPIPADMTDGNLTDTFANYQAGRGFSPATVRRREVSLRAFRALIAPVGLLDATPAMIDEFVHSHRAPATRRAYRADLGAFYRWAERRGMIDANPVERTESIKVPRSLPAPVAVELVEPLIAAARDREVALAVALGAYAGLRLGDIAKLDRADLVFGSGDELGLIVVRRGKGGKDRSVPMHPALVPRLRGLPAGRLIACKPGTLGPKVARHLRMHGVEATLHKLRHTFGTEAARASNGNLLLVAELMGHDSLETTTGYTRLVGVRTADTVAGMFGRVACAPMLSAAIDTWAA